MRIQHNIMAMNAYRNYNNNTSALSKNLEKLSSGYKINRAGDDAAGLAISEKMRAQITGLETAQKNVKDGISLVKTGEGAMQEVQDMLNRMVEHVLHFLHRTLTGLYQRDTVLYVLLRSFQTSDLCAHLLGNRKAGRVVARAVDLVARGQLFKVLG